MSHTILIVEDNELNMKLFNDLLKAQGYETVQSSDGSDVIEIARGRHLDLIIMDIQLPSCSGLDITKELKSEKAIKDIPVIIVSAFDLKGNEEKVRAAGCDDYIPKPILLPTFLETVARHLS